MQEFSKSTLKSLGIKKEFNYIHFEKCFNKLLNDYNDCNNTKKAIKVFI